VVALPTHAYVIPTNSQASHCHIVALLRHINGIIAQLCPASVLSLTLL